MSCTISCPSCQRTLRVPESLLGQAVKCPTCSHNFTAPDGGEDEAPRPPAPAPVPERPSRRPATPPPEDDYEEEPRPSKRRSRSDDHDEDYDEAPRRRRGRRDEKPGKVQAIAIMILIGGILATFASLFTLGYLGFTALIGSVPTLGLSFGCCLWPGPYYGLVVGIMSIVKGARLLGENAYRQSPPSGIGVMMIINIINCDAVNLTLGILVLVFLSDPEVKEYYQG